MRLASAGYGFNTAYRALVAALLYGEDIRWNNELKVYTAKVHTAVQAQGILDAMRTLDGHGDDLPTTIDEAIFERATPAVVQFVPDTLILGATSHSQQVLLVVGLTFPLKSMLREKGFVYERNFNNREGFHAWAAPIEKVDVEELASLIEEKGFIVEKYDGMQGEACTSA